MQPGSGRGCRTSPCWWPCCDTATSTRLPSRPTSRSTWSRTCRRRRRTLVSHANKHVVSPHASTCSGGGEPDAGHVPGHQVLPATSQGRRAGTHDRARGTIRNSSCSRRRLTFRLAACHVGVLQPPRRRAVGREAALQHHDRGDCVPRTEGVADGRHGLCWQRRLLPDSAERCGALPWCRGSRPTELNAIAHMLNVASAELARMPEVTSCECCSADAPAHALLQHRASPRTWACWTASVCCARIKAHGLARRLFQRSMVRLPRRTGEAAGSLPG